MCQAYKLGMTQSQGYVWFLPNWYQNDWYNLDLLRNLTGDRDGGLPNCTTAEMIDVNFLGLSPLHPPALTFVFPKVLQGHLSLAHANYANDEEIMQTGNSVIAWRQRLEENLRKSHFAHLHPSKYSGYVYDGVWLYALALDRLIKQNQSYIQDIHSERSINKFVEIIRSTDFYGVSGRINFVHGNSRLSNIKVRGRAFLSSCFRSGI